MKQMSHLYAGRSTFDHLLILLTFFIFLPFPSLAEWESNLVQFPTTHGSTEMVAVSDSTVVVVWHEKRAGGPWDIYARKVKVDGTVLWTVNGVKVFHMGSSDQTNPKVCIDGDGGVIITCQGQRNGTWNIYAQRLNSDGDPQWTFPGGGPGGITGVIICGNSVADQVNPRIVSDGSGGAVLAWEDKRNGNWDVYAQRIDSNGVISAGGSWVSDGVALTKAPQTQQQLELAQDGSGGAFATWTHKPGTSGRNVWATRILADGSIASGWEGPGPGATGKELISTSFARDEPVVTYAEGGNAIFAFTDLSLLGTGPDKGVFALKMTGSGAVFPSWPSEGVAVCYAINNSSPSNYVGDRPEIVYDGAGGAIIVARSRWSVTDNDLLINRISSSGVPLWWTPGTPGPLTVEISSANMQMDYKICSDLEQGAYVVYTMNPGSTGYDVYMDHWDSSAVHSTQLVCNAGQRQKEPAIATACCKPIVAWADNRPIPGPTGSSFNVFAWGEGVEVECILSVELLSFDVISVGHSVEISWTTASEQNNDEFIVFHSSDGMTYSEIDRIKGAGNSTALRGYITYDHSPAPGINYYYLTQVDFDGTPESFPPRAILIRSDENIQVYPNPASEAVSISLSLNRKTQIIIDFYDIMGRSLIQKNENVFEGGNTFTYATNSLPGGTYLVRISTPSEVIMWKKLIIQE